MERAAQREGCVAGRETAKHARLHRADRGSGGGNGEAGGEDSGRRTQLTGRGSHNGGPPNDENRGGGRGKKGRKREEGREEGGKGGGGRQKGGRGEARCAPRPTGPPAGSTSPPHDARPAPAALLGAGPRLPPAGPAGGGTGRPL